MLGICQSAQAIEPNARLVPIRPLRRVIRLGRQEREFQSKAVHHGTWWIDRDQLFQSLTPEELNLNPGEPAQHLLLLPLPEQELTPATWERLWRSLFHDVRRSLHGYGHAGLEESSRLPSATLLGPARWEAIRQVLLEENLIDESDDSERILREFASFSREVLSFQPGDWDTYFPGLNDDEPPLLSLSSIVDRERLLASSRPPGYPADAFVSIEAEHPRHSHPVSQASAETLPDDRGSANDILAAVAMFRESDPRAVGHIDRLVQRLRHAPGTRGR